jgi:ABC-2 type transport system ATP-binding protein
VTAALELASVSKRFGRVGALDAVSLAVPVGGLFGLLGPNGAGKTTLLGVAAGFLRADAGEVRRLGRLSWLPQDASFQPGVPLGEQLELFGRLSGLGAREAREDAGRVLEAVRLGDAGRRLPRELSHGMRKRAALGQALLGEPELVFLDEPTAGLDPENARHVREIVRSLRGRCTVVLCSHNLHEIQELCDHVAVLHEGRIVESGPLEQLTAAALRLRISLGTPGAARAAELLSALGEVSAVGVTGECDVDVHLRPGADRDAAVRAVLARLLECDLVPHRLLPGASLEARFLELTSGR